MSNIGFEEEQAGLVQYVPTLERYLSENPAVQVFIAENERGLSEFETTKHNKRYNGSTQKRLRDAVGRVLDITQQRPQITFNEFGLDHEQCRIRKTHPEYIPREYIQGDILSQEGCMCGECCQTGIMLDTIGRYSIKDITLKYLLLGESEEQVRMLTEGILSGITSKRLGITHSVDSYSASGNDFYEYNPQNPRIRFRTLQDKLTALQMGPVDEALRGIATRFLLK